MKKIIFEIPIKIETANNRPVNFWVAAERQKEHRYFALPLTLSAVHGAKFYPSKDEVLQVTIMRVSPGVLDSDNLGTSFKGIRDGIADGLWRKNDTDNFIWKYDQASRGRDYTVFVEVKVVE